MKCNEVYYENEYKKNVEVKANKGMEFQRNGFCWSPHNSKSARIQLLFSFEMNKQSKIFNDPILLFKNNWKIYIILFACLANGHTALLAVCPLFPELCLRVCLERILQPHTLTPFSLFLTFSLSLPCYFKLCTVRFSLSSSHGLVGWSWDYRFLALVKCM